MFQNVLTIVCLAFVCVHGTPSWSCNSNNMMENIAESLSHISRLLVKTSKLEGKMEAFTKEIERKLAQIDVKLETQAEQIKHTYEETSIYVDKTSKIIDRKLNGLADQIKPLSDDINKEIERKLAQIDVKLETQAERIKHTYDVLTEENKETRNLAVKKDIVFNVKTITEQPAHDAIIKFTTAVVNIDGVYDMATGYFTAPRPGTYWFSAQICSGHKKAIAPSIWINDQLISRMFVQDKDNNDCSPVTAVAVLDTNDTVCVKSGPISYSSPVWISGSEHYRINSFMGSLVN